MRRPVLLLLFLLPLTSAGAQVRLLADPPALFRINRITVENPRRTAYRRLSVLGRNDRGELVPLFVDPAPGARERMECRFYLDDTIAELIVELEPERGRPESFSLQVPVQEARIGVFGVPRLLPAPYIRREEPETLEPGDLYVDSGELGREELAGLLEAGIHCLVSRAGFDDPEPGRFRGILIRGASADPDELDRVLAARRGELVQFKAAYRNLVTAGAFYGIASRDPRPSFTGAGPGDIAATLARDSFQWRLTRPQVLALAVFYAACLLLLVLVRSAPLLLGLLAVLALGFFLVLFQVPAREHLLVVELNPAALDAPKLSFAAPRPGLYRSLSFSEAAPLLAYRQFASFRKRLPLSQVGGAVWLRSNQIPTVRIEKNQPVLEYADNPLKIWTLHSPAVPAVPDITYAPQ